MTKEKNDAIATTERSKPMPWQKSAKGIPVEEGKNWITGLTHDQRIQAMNNHEQFWKKKYNSHKGTVGLQQNWTRGIT